MTTPRRNSWCSGEDDYQPATPTGQPSEREQWNDFLENLLHTLRPHPEAHAKIRQLMHDTLDTSGPAID